MGLSSKDAKKLNKASVLSTSKDPKDWDSARARQVDVDYKDLVRQLKAKRRKKVMKEQNELAGKWKIDSSAHKKVQKKAKIRNLAKGNTNPNEKAAAEKKAGKNPEGGLNEKGRKSYERDNPGSDLKAPQPEGGSRKKSFCARMGGMKKKLTSAKTANDPDSRINKALRKWKC